MKIISWNVNGLRACIENGFKNVIKELDADIYCIQETKADKSKISLNLEGYTEYWSSSYRKGYSGVLVLCKCEPISVQYGFGNDKFDVEGRCITLEYSNFYLVNTYMPLSKSSLKRSQYRMEWDDAFLNFVTSLSKPTIICGDLNVAHKYIDIYETNLRNIENPPGFKAFERANFDRLLSCGYVDSFRQLYPYIRKYSWWSLRGNRRSQNMGWRLDYFLVFSSLFPKVKSSDMLSGVLASDHCPIELEIDLELSSETTENEKLSKMWEAIDWNYYEKELFKKQRELAIAIKDRDRTLGYEIQNEILNMSIAKFLAVRNVSNNFSEPGVDRVRWVTSAEKARAALSLDEYNFIPSPAKSIVIFDGHKDRNINIPTYYDKAIQTLIKYALEPVAETTGDRKSFAFRKGRSTFDAMSYIKSSLKKSRNLWVLRGDIKSYYDTISHEWIFNNLPMRQSIKKLLKAGIVMNGELFPSDTGISLGSPISPIIGNMVLDGMQTSVFKSLYKNKEIENYVYGDMIRFADDFVFFAKDYEQALEIQNIVKSFLSERGLRLSDEKTFIAPASDGFDFIGWNFRQIGISPIITPSEKSVKAFESNIEKKILNHNGSIEALIKSINQSIYGFANYHKVTDCRETFAHLDNVIEALLIKKVKILHPKRPWEQLKKVYWYIDSQGNPVFSVPDNKSIHIFQMRNVDVCFHYAVKTSFNYFIDNDYLQKLEKQRDIDHHLNKYKSIWTKQNGKCFICGKDILPDHYSRIVKYPNVGEVYIHSKCKENLISYNYKNESTRGVIVSDLLNEITLTPDEDDRYIGLREYFIDEKRQVFTLTFNEINSIIGEPILDNLLQEDFFYDNKYNSISKVWTENGYIIQSLYINKEKIVFRKKNHDLANLKIPKKLTQSKIPKNAETELENFFDYIIKKYNL